MLINKTKRKAAGADWLSAHEVQKEETLVCADNQNGGGLCRDTDWDGWDTRGGDSVTPVYSNV